MGCALIVSLLLLAETPDKLTPEGTEALKEMRDAMKAAVELLETGKDVEFVEWFIASVKDRFKGEGQEERIREAMEEGGRDYYPARCKAARDGALRKWIEPELDTFRFYFDPPIPLPGNPEAHVSVGGSKKTWHI